MLDVGKNGSQKTVKPPTTNDDRWRAVRIVEMAGVVGWFEGKEKKSRTQFQTLLRHQRQQRKKDLEEKKSVSFPLVPCPSSHPSHIVKFYFDPYFLFLLYCLHMEPRRYTQFYQAVCDSEQNIFRFQSLFFRVDRPVALPSFCFVFFFVLLSPTAFYLIPLRSSR